MSDNPEDYELFHYGVKGMKWGERHSRPEGVTRSANRAAKKDASEFAKAKMFYGEGAGTRRKLIKAKVNQRSSDPGYKKAFDQHLSKQDMAKRADQARGARARKDTVKQTTKTARGVKNLVMQTGAPVAMSSVAIYAAWKNPTVRHVVSKNSKMAYSAVKNSPVVDMAKSYFKK